jgi:hypothetical protein
MQEPAAASTWWQTWWQELLGAFNRGEFAAMLRATLFLTCLTAILNHARLLDWVDVLALKFLPEKAFEQQPPQHPANLRTLVLGITPDLFEQSFGGHTPINRDRFRQLIEAVLAAYPNVRVLAVDYDLAPGAGKPCDLNSEDSVCDIAELELQQQQRLQEFLNERFAPTAEGSRANCRVQLVLITPLKEKDDYSEVEQTWLKQDQAGCVRFGEHFLANHNWLETVVKHRTVGSPGDACAGEDDSAMPLALVVNRARRCAGVIKTLGPAPSGEVAIINFAKAREAIFLCALWDGRDIGGRCHEWLRTIKADPAAIDTVFIGSSYGEEDKFRTPLGDQFGVELHAFGAYSQLHPLRDPKALSFAIDIAVGILSAIVFQSLWGGAQRYAAESAQRFFFIVAVFAVLLLAAWGALRLMPGMLKYGFWMNPLMIFVGLFVDSYAGAIERVHRPKHDDKESAQASMIDAVRIFTGWPAVADPNHQRIFRFCKKLVIYWVVVASALYFTLVLD